MHYYTDVFKKYAQFSGRARRAEYWMFFLFNAIVMLILLVLGLAVSKVLFVLYGLYALAVIVPSLALTCRRLHDTGRSGGWFFISFVPFIGGIWLFVLTLLEGDRQANMYGPDPKAPAGIPQY
ncbi:DUF805 domain-containing protein [Streptomyces sp. SID11385]|uniref:DUF805 domain-containing protein n=1 Tax=Streptomyces sp. SID11385 TaxID=2706031 RepID=UPI0013C81C2E|nr:DUF805 domain-containing protein [Streptomyces sp. SID11385]NEA42774.1 DUF805 domain-containing protein [Streptomyces sp. SID11385]